MTIDEQILYLMIRCPFRQCSHTCGLKDYEEISEENRKIIIENMTQEKKEEILRGCTNCEALKKVEEESGKPFSDEQISILKDIKKFLTHI